MTTINKSGAYLVLTLLWSWIFFEIPFILQLIKHISLTYEYDDKYLYIRKGVLNRTSNQVLLFKIKSVHASSNIIGDGTLLIMSSMGYFTLKHVANPQKVQAELMRISEEKKEGEDVKRVEVV